jgi:methylthioribulose-1-phosphate dehydratase
MELEAPLLPHADALIEAGRRFDARGWVPASGGNFSVRLEAGQRLITASGRHKGRLTRADFLVVDAEGQPLAGGKASYETPLHMALYRRDPAIGAVLHTHSIANTVLSRRRPGIVLCGYELLKVLPGAPDPTARVELPVFENDQDIPRLARRVDAYLDEHPATPAYLIAGHGLYAWGADAFHALCAVEALEFMLACQLEERDQGPSS